MTVSLNRHHINCARAFLGLSANVLEVAEALKVSPLTLRRRLSALERKAWASDVRADKPTHLQAAVRKIRVKYLSLGRWPSARESSVHSSIMTECGGYSAILLEAQKGTDAELPQ